MTKDHCLLSAPSNSRQRYFELSLVHCNGHSLKRSEGLALSARSLQSAGIQQCAPVKLTTSLGKSKQLDTAMESRAYDGEGNDKSQNKCKSDQLFGYSNYHVHTIGIMGCTMHRMVQLQNEAYCSGITMASYCVVNIGKQTAVINVFSNGNV